MTPIARLSGASLGSRVTDMDLAVSPQSCVVFVGKNGAGKSTVLQLLAGLLAPTRGSAELSGRPIGELGERQRAGLAAWLPQRPQVEGTLTAREVVGLARFRFDEGMEASSRVAEAHLAHVGARHLTDQRLDSMSGGEAQRVLLAALRAQEAPLLLVDEPANHLDPLAQVHTYQALGELWHNEGATLCLVTHDLRLCQLLGPAERVLVVGVAAGRITWQLPLSAPELPLELEHLYGVPFAPSESPGGLGIAVDRLEPARP